MSVDIFIDTNVFIYHLESIDQKKSKIAENIILTGIQESNACISFQVVQECLNTITRKAEISLDFKSKKQYLDNILVPLWRVSPNSLLYHKSLEIQEKYRYAYYDSLIIAAAIEAGCTTLYSEDLQHGQQIERLTVKNPFINH